MWRGWCTLVVMVSLGLLEVREHLGKDLNDEEMMVENLG